ncbi:DUF202 domain-containing protein [Sandaracinobacter sp. RS1-74]|uniref:YidH family protein n=1 Tax=Sandaracinobacteroides sayramensis TaxID=2913411 RepID=UPI001EDC7428|nr:DUF202 domain-containing protein [Sandaracinobacteroides sayramensis]MCG2841605.1 DUF202 domain-containing protein [Sandaracinobacteroides sayramensis]
MTAPENNPLPDVGTILSSRRTGMSFQRTRMSADRTLMSVIRTSLSLISFGFTINQAFTSLQALDAEIAARAPQIFGGSLVGLGTVMLAFGILYHLQFMAFLRGERQKMADDGLITGKSPYPISLTLLTALALLLIGILAIAHILFGL